MRIAANGWFWDQMATGSGQYLAALAEALPRPDHSHEFMLVRPQLPQGQGALPDGWRVLDLGTPFDRVNRQLAKLWFEQVTFPRACARLRADVAFVPYWGSPWWQPCPVVVTVHDLIPLLLPLYRGGAAQRAYTRLVSCTARRASAVLTDSEASRKDIIRHLRVPAERIHAVHLAVGPPGKGSLTLDCLAAVRARYHLPEGPMLLYLGGFDVRKNLSRTIEGYGRLLARCTADGIPAPSFVIAGKLPACDSTFAPDPRLIVERLGLGNHVHFAGWVAEADKPALYALAEGVLFLSEYEGFGLPVLEAMADG
jgi:glycosyltransferase involved in cell wall biosynthesis